LSDLRLAAPLIPPDAGGATEPLDRAAALALVGGNENLLAELAGMFLEDCPRWLAEMAESLRGADAKGLHFTAHLLRGTLSWFGPSPAAGPARELEAAARAGDLTAAARAFADLEAALRRLTPALTALAGNTS